MIDQMIANIDAMLADYVNQILHHPKFQALESVWRSLHHLVSHINFEENIELRCFCANKNELLENFEDSPDITYSKIYRTVYAKEFGVFGGKPYGVICSLFEFDHRSSDLRLLKQLSAIGAMAHAPVLGNLSAQFFGLSSFTQFWQIKDLKSLLDGPEYIGWHSLREREDSRYLGLTLPRFLLRTPYLPENYQSQYFHFEEDVCAQHDTYLWGLTSVALLERIADSFARYRWCPNIIGPLSGGTVDNLPVHVFDSMGEKQVKIPTEILITERQELELSEHGLISLVYRKDTDQACFFSANSVQKIKKFPDTQEGLTAQTNFMLGAQLPYMFIITRISHYLKVLQREHIGSARTRTALEDELNRWLGQYVSAMDNPSLEVRAARPLRSARITVSDIQGQPGWYACAMLVQPHMKYLGANFTLSLVGKLDKV